MKVRVLPREEWGRARATGAPWMPCVRDEDRNVLAVEDDAGALVATWTVLRQTRLEGLYVDPGHKNGGVGRALMTATAEFARGKYGDEWAFVDALDPQVLEWVKRLGGAPIPGVTCYVPLTEFVPAGKE